MKVQLVVVQGKQRGQCLHFPPGEFVFGRGPECHVRPNSELVSRQHCLLAVSPIIALIRDLGSTNGTLVNGHRVRGAQVLQEGDQLQIGPLVLQVKFTSTTTDTMPDSALSERTGTLPDAPIGDGLAGDKTMGETDEGRLV